MTGGTIAGYARRAAAAGVFALALTAAGAAPADTAEGPARPTADLSWSARVLAPVTARALPSSSARPIVVLQPNAPIAQGPQVLLVLGRRDVGGREWVRVLLPLRPNGASGWVPSDVLRFHSTTLRVVVDQSDRRLTVFRAGRPVMSTKVAVGTPKTPTPMGRFAVAERIYTGTPRAFLGPVVLPLTGYSEKLNEYAGGNGRVAMHGTSLPQLLGTRASHGCIRIGNAAVMRLARMAMPGTPVLIRP